MADGCCEPDKELSDDDEPDRSSDDRLGDLVTCVWFMDPAAIIEPVVEAAFRGDACGFEEDGDAERRFLMEGDAGDGVAACERDFAGLCDLIIKRPGTSDVDADVAPAIRGGGEGELHFKFNVEMDDDDDRERGPRADDLDEAAHARLKRPSNVDENGNEIFLDTKRAKTNVWLVKVPDFVAKAWAGIEKEGVELGRLRVYSQPKVQNQPGTSSRQPPAHSNPKVSLHLPPNAHWSEKLPKKFNLNFIHSPSTPSVNPSSKAPTGPQQSTYVFGEDSEGRAREVSGKIVHEGTLSAVIDQDYRDVMKRRANAETARKKVVQRIDEKMGKKIMAAGSSNVAAGAGDKGIFGVAPKKSLDKRERMAEPDLINLLFELFREVEYNSFKTLQDKTNQPQMYLKEVVKKICIQHTKGTYNGFYSLKPEYVAAKAEDAAAAASASGSGVKNEEEMDDDDDDLDDLE
ncbi:hypothetical protein HK101_007906 [Irineochytrium annulatum]|nr:hypothetical protein HK101_007906 [Irineochytrium annulatum]